LRNVKVRPMSNVQRPTLNDKSCLALTRYFFRRHSGGRCLFLFSVLVLIFACTASGISRKTPDQSYAPGELIVAFYETVSGERIREIVSEEGGRIGKALGGRNLFLILFPEETDIPGTAERFSDYPEVRYAEPNYRAILLEKK